MAAFAMRRILPAKPTPVASMGTENAAIPDPFGEDLERGIHADGTIVEPPDPRFVTPPGSAEVDPQEAFDPQEQADMVSHINNVLRDAPVLSGGPMNPLGNDVLHKVAGGELLGSLLATSDPDALDLRALNTAPLDGSDLSPEAQLENHTLLVNAAASVGAAVPMIHETQLLYAPQHKQVALQQAYNIIKHGLLSKINVMTQPHLAALLADGEKPGQVPPEALLSRWINKQVDDYLRQHPQDRRRLPTEIAVSETLDGDVSTQLAMALHQVAKEPMLSVGNSILPTVPIAPQGVGGEAPAAGGAWGSSALGGKGSLLRSAEDGAAAASRAPPTAHGGTDELNTSIDHRTNDPALARSTASAPTTPFVSQLAAAPPGSTTLPMPLQQTILPTSVQMPLAAVNAGEGLPEAFWRAGPEARAKQVVDHAIAAAGPKIFAVAPSDLTQPRPRMQQCFVASVVDAFGDGGEEGELDTYEEETNDAAEGRVFKNWAASLGLKLNMKDLYADSCTGIVLLKVMERLQPGSVDWSRVKGSPKNRYEKGDNCEYALGVARKLGCKVVGIQGSDIAEGNEKLLLAVWWQLMRKDLLQFLDELDMDSAHVLAWANARVLSAGCDVQLSKFGDPAVKSGVFLLELMRAVAPLAIREDLIKPGITELERQLNAKLAISTAHKMGARVFCGWQDILEARPKLVLSMIAAVMSVDMLKTKATKQDVMRGVERAQVLRESLRASGRMPSARGSPRGDNGESASPAGSPRSVADEIDSLRESIRFEVDPPSQAWSRAKAVGATASKAATVVKALLPGARGKAAAQQDEVFQLKLTDGDSALPPARAEPPAPPPGTPPTPTPRGGAPEATPRQPDLAASAAAALAPRPPQAAGTPRSLAPPPSAAADEVPLAAVHRF